MPRDAFETDDTICSNQRYGPRLIIGAVRERAPRVADLMEAHWGTSLADFGAEMLNPAPRPESAHSKVAFEILKAELGVEAEAQFGPESRDVLTEFASSRCMNFGQHCQLLLDPVSFYTHIFTQLSAMARGLKYVPYYLCSTVTLESAARFGPAWVDLGERRIRVVDLPRPRLRRSSVYASPDLRFRIKETESLLSQNLKVATRRAVGDLSEGMRRVESLTLGEAFVALNYHLINRWDPEGDFRPLMFTDSFAYRLIRRHLNDETLVGQIVLDPERRARIAAEQRKERELDSSGFVPSSTQLFWGLRAGRLVPLIATEGALKSRDDDSLVLALKTGDLIQALDDRRIVPDLFLVYLAASIMPRVTVLGGLRQLGYYGAFQRSLRNALIKSERDEASLFQELTWQSQGWACRVIERLDSPIDVLYGEGSPVSFRRLVAKAGQWSLSNASAEGTGFITHPKWERVIARRADELGRF